MASLSPPPPPASQQQSSGPTVSMSRSLSMGEKALATHHHLTGRARRSYKILACPAFHSLAERIAAADPHRFTYFPSRWEKFADGTDNLELGGFTPVNRIRGEHVVFLASFHSNDTALTQFFAMIALLESFIESLTVVLPFYPTATMERVVKEGVVATASTMARIFNCLPSCGRPTCLMIYDLHTLQNRFYLSGHCIAQLESTIPLLKEHMLGSSGHADGANAAGAASSVPPVDMVAFPDDGAAKRFGSMFEGYSVVICGKHRDGDRRVVTIQDGDPSQAKHVLIVDDLIQTGGTLFEAAGALKAAGAPMVSAFCAHGVFPNASWRRFCRGGDRAIFERFWITNSIPTTTDALPDNDVFAVIDIMPAVMADLP
jgi:phosphoribosylpyrophosphate synthetase